MHHKASQLGEERVDRPGAAGEHEEMSDPQARCHDRDFRDEDGTSSMSAACPASSITPETRRAACCDALEAHAEDGNALAMTKRISAASGMEMRVVEIGGSGRGSPPAPNCKPPPPPPQTSRCVRARMPAAWSWPQSGRPMQEIVMGWGAGAGEDCLLDHECVGF